MSSSEESHAKGVSIADKLKFAAKAQETASKAVIDAQTARDISSFLVGKLRNDLLKWAEEHAVS